MRAEKTKVTLVVLQHGLWGKPVHMQYIEDSLIEAYGDKNVAILNAKSNDFGLTYDGVDVCGQRLADEIQSFVQDLARTGKRVTRCTMVGYSLGGLIIRYAIGILGREGFFDTIEPILFATFATPHAGASRPQDSLYDFLYDYFCARLLNRSGYQLQFRDRFDDDQPLLHVLADPDREFFHYLAQFKHRRLYTNIVNEQTVTYCSSAIRPDDPYRNIMVEDLEITTQSAYPSVITSIAYSEKSKVEGFSFNRWHRRTKEFMISCAAYILAPIWFPLLLLFGCYQHICSKIRLAKVLPNITETYRTAGLVSSRSSISSCSSDSIATESSKLFDKSLPGYDSMKKDTIIIPIHNSSEKLASNTKEQVLNVPPASHPNYKCRSPALDENQLKIVQNLGLLSWDRVLLYINGVNAHATMICREKIYINDDGRASVKHFVDTIQL